MRSTFALADVSVHHPEEYHPWIHTREVAKGNGRRCIIPDLKYPKRSIYLMSGLEEKVYYMLRSNENVEELFEQYPLDIKITTKLCERFEISHPRDPATKELVVMTTDFVALLFGAQNRTRAYAVKTSEDLRNERVAEKLLIEKCYWDYFQVPWCVITEKTI